ncbi:IS110 family transposase [Lysinibacillus parviboronicapiens]|jgi:transposase|uniref:IS110 family transposase n=1 Tax=Lysinibacillus parviboronicapiens TaxID=436516 RepID=UPI000D3A9232|nr:IS110 family transposase [Lysinibacillus parviboronicapiens]
MNPVVGLDVAKGESQVQMFLDKKMPYKSSVKVDHTVDGLEELHSYLLDLERQTGMKPPVVLESTGHYHAPVVQFLEAREYIVIIVNPLVSYRAKSSSLRKTKTDAIDAYHLGELYYKEDLAPQKKRGVQLLNLRHLTRQHENMTGIMIQTKLQFQAVLDQIFPEYKGVFGDLYAEISIKTLQAYPTSESVKEAGVEEIAQFIDTHCKARSFNWALERSEKLIGAAERNPFQSTLYQSLLVSLNMYIDLLQVYHQQLSTLEREIDELAAQLEEYELLQSIPGIGEKIAATIISEIGEIDRFNHPKKLVAFAGLDPSVFESGRFKGTKNHITKRGSAMLRHMLYTAVRCSIRDSRKKKTTPETIARNKRLRAFYDLKREEGKPYKVAIIACANKLLHWIYAILKTKTPFQETM